MLLSLIASELERIDDTVQPGTTPASRRVRRVCDCRILGVWPQGHQQVGNHEDRLHTLEQAA